MNRIKIKILVVISLVVINVQSVLGQQVTMIEAQNAARLMSKRSSGKETEIKNVYFKMEGDKVYLYEFEMNDGYSVLLSGNKQCHPSLARYKTETKPLLAPDRESLPPGIKIFINDYCLQIERAFQRDEDSVSINDEWALLLDSGVYDMERNIPGSAPLLESTWGQSVSDTGEDGHVDPYAFNYYVQSGAECAHCMAGCVAVAMAQIMYYYMHPVLSIKTKTQFDWCNMSNQLVPSADDYEKNRDAIANLIVMCGTAVNMIYGCSASGAYPENLISAFERFGYHVDGLYSRLHLGNHFMTALTASLAIQQPIIYNASSEEGGHTFICDGYNANENKFHFNWGYNGKYDGYYYIDNLNANHQYNYNHSIVTGIYPEGEQSLCDIELIIGDFYEEMYDFYPTYHELPYNLTPKTMTKLFSAAQSSPSSWRTIPSGATAEYVAHKEVVLRPGFTAERGSDFTARIEPCEMCETAMLELRIAEGDASEETHADTTLIPRVYRIGDTTFEVRQSALRLYPNPTEQQLTIGSAEEVKDIRLYDQRGHAVYRWYVSRRGADGLTLEVGDIPTGTYIVHVTTLDGRTHMGRFVKK